MSMEIKNDVLRLEQVEENSFRGLNPWVLLHRAESRLCAIKDALQWIRWEFGEGSPQFAKFTKDVVSPAEADFEEARRHLSFAEGIQQEVAELEAAMLWRKLTASEKKKLARYRKMV